MYKVIIYFSDIDNDNEYFTNWEIIDFNDIDKANDFYNFASGCVWYKWKEIIKVVKDY